ncbi:MAG: peptide-methionine (S)-S-oxide reductase MsrA [Acidobacteria bacterium]|nr:peptide-methionine (S)-S-oxide reductase MsrA [Acidobacteriota bacterium]
MCAWFGIETNSSSSPEHAPPGRSKPIWSPGSHDVLGTSLAPPFPQDSERALFALGCFWGAERIFWLLEGVYTTAVGYAAGLTPNPTYQEVCTGATGHTEVVLVVFDPVRIDYERLLSVFWEGHDPTQGMRQGNDRGTQYRSGIYTFSPVQLTAATASRERYQEQLSASGLGAITTQIEPAGEFFYAEEYHQQYVAKNPDGYCGIVGTGVSCPIGVIASES